MKNVAVSVLMIQDWTKPVVTQVSSFTLITSNDITVLPCSSLVDLLNSHRFLCPATKSSLLEQKRHHFFPSTSGLLIPDLIIPNKLKAKNRSHSMLRELSLTPMIWPGHMCLSLSSPFIGPDQDGSRQHAWSGDV